VLDDLEASEDVTLGINEGLTVLESNQLSDFILINKIVLLFTDEWKNMILPDES